MSKEMRRRLWFWWRTSRFCTRMAVEHVATIWLLGIAPFLARLSSAAWRGEFRWLWSELYLFVMVVAGNTAIEAFKDRRSDGPLRPMFAMLGSLVAVVAVWAFATLEAGPRPLATVLRSVAPHAIIVGLGIDLLYVLPKIMIDAMNEAREKGRTA
jgi:hypothetical protein